MPSIAPPGTIYGNVVNNFAITMITIGIGRCNTYRNNVYNINCLQWWSKVQESSTLVNGKLKQLIINQLEIVFTLVNSFAFLLVVFIIRRKTVNRTRWSQKCNRCCILHDGQGNCFRAIWSKLPLFRLPISSNELSWGKAMEAGAIIEINNTV